jgi:hypothetical protein
MNKEYILKLEQYTISRIIEFGEKYKNENIIETSYIDWNARDVIGHINCWVEYSKEKLESIKTNKLFKDIEHNDIEIYKLNNLFENKEIKEKHFTALLNIIKNKDNKFVEEIIRINMI